nr:GNAT family protein [Angustibacter aerolatus]
MQRYADGHAADERHLWGVWRDGDLVGGVLFPHFDVGQGVCEIGVWLAPGTEGRGVARRALEPLLQWAFERGVVRVEWQAAPGNVRSIALAERLGFRHEGVLRQSAVVDGVRQDTALLALLAADRA